MKIKIKVVDMNGNAVTGEANSRNKELFEMIKKCRSKVFVPKKGKGSFKRNKTNFDFD